jgi:hypothetical protein
MRTIFLACLLLAAWPSARAAEAAQSAPAEIHGKVLETLDAGSYTYLRLQGATGEVWVSIYKAPVAVGADVGIDHLMAMKDFTSKTLHRTFPLLYLGMLEGAPAAAGPAAAPADGVDAKVAKPAGADAHTIADVIAHARQLAGSTVAIRGKVVKYNPDIMGRNWVHLRDGSAKGSDEILVTTASPSSLGAIVQARGKVRTDADFGAGYAYPVLLEDATLQP